MKTTHAVMDEQEFRDHDDSINEHDSLKPCDTHDPHDLTPLDDTTMRTSKSRRMATPSETKKPKPSPVAARRERSFPGNARERAGITHQHVTDADWIGIEQTVERISEKFETLLKILTVQARAMAKQAQAMMMQATSFRLRKSVLTFDEACIYLDVSESHLYKLTADGIVPHSKPNGKKLYFRRKELDAWLMSNPIKVHSDIEREAATYCLTHDRPRSRRRNIRQANQ